MQKRNCLIRNYFISLLDKMLMDKMFIDKLLVDKMFIDNIFAIRLKIKFILIKSYLAIIRHKHI